jgi:hypothetical protein
MVHNPPPVRPAAGSLRTRLLRANGRSATLDRSATPALMHRRTLLETVVAGGRGVGALRLRPA